MEICPNRLGQPLGATFSNSWLYALHMLPDSAVPLADDSPGCVLETTPRKVQHDSNPSVYRVSLNREWLAQLGIGYQSAQTVHALATRPVEIRNPAIIIQPVEVDR